MIYLVFGGTGGDKDFKLWLAKDKIKYVKVFDGMVKGSLGKFANACISSALPLVQKNYHGDLVGLGMQNDTLLVNFYESDILEDAERVIDKARSFHYLAIDLELNCKLLEYPSHKCVTGISSFID